MISFLEIPTSLSSLKVIERRPFVDARGSFSKLWSTDELKTLGWTEGISQVNYSVTNQIGTVRGLHYQIPPYAEMKLITCIKGEVLDVAVDLRKGSPTFLKWHCEILSAQNNKSLLIPKGFAHGFQVLSPSSELIYLHSSSYSAEHEGGVLAEDPLVRVKWPLPISGRSSRDQLHRPISLEWKGLEI